jgi:flagellar L-ring protein precursor FlgH
MLLLLLITTLLLALFPVLGLAQLAPSPGSVYSPSGRLADAARDPRAGLVNDILTIVVNENASAVVTGVTNTSRKSSVQSGISGLAGTLPATSRLTNLLGASNNQTLQGQGTTSRNVTLSTTISARVVEVMPNGVMVVEGTKDLAVNAEKQTILVRGMVRPADVTPANTVLSTQVAGLQVHVTGKGVVNDAIKRPFFLYRLLLGLLPF